MPRPEEDQPNCDLPPSTPFLSEGQFWRVQVPRPQTQLLLGQRVSPSAESPMHDMAAGGKAPSAPVTQGFGYPGVTLTTDAAFFADVHEPTVWQGHDVVAFQTAANTELHSGRAVVLGATRWGDHFERTTAPHLERTRAQTHLYGQLRDHAIGYHAYSLARATLGLAKTILSAPLIHFNSPKVIVKAASFKAGATLAAAPAEGLAKSAPKVIGAAAAISGLRSASQELKDLTPLTAAPEPGVHLTSHQGIFLASSAGTNVLAAQGFNVLSGLGVSLHGGTTFTASATFAVDLFALGTASMSALWSSEVGALRNSSLIAKIGTAAVLGKTVQLGSQKPGEEAVSLAIPASIPKVGGTMLNRRMPTESVIIEALKSIESNVVGKFVINAPVGEVNSTSRKATVKAVESITLDTVFGKVQVTATGVTITAPGASVKVSAVSVEITGGAAKVTVGPVGVNVRSAGSVVNVMPGGVVSVQGTLIKLG